MRKHSLLSERKHSLLSERKRSLLSEQPTYKHTNINVKLQKF